tara:strand:+ start:343 stop:597 length:255 start_codon:yes stop_codon:yes gene_type:complete
MEDRVSQLIDSGKITRDEATIFYKLLIERSGNSEVNCLTSDISFLRGYFLAHVGGWHEGRAFELALIFFTVIEFDIERLKCYQL